MDLAFPKKTQIAGIVQAETDNWQLENSLQVCIYINMYYTGPKEWKLWQKRLIPCHKAGL